MFARFFPALTRLSIQQMLTFALFVGILSAGFFLAFVSPLVGTDNIRTAVQNATDPNRIAGSIGQIIPLGPPQPTNPIPNGPYCGDATCDAGESFDTCALDCFACNANSNCDVEIGENQNSCPTDCVPATACDNDGICDLHETTHTCPTDCISGNGTGDGTETTDPPVTPKQTCGNGKIEGNEACDTAALNSKTCLTQGFAEGALSCRSDCIGFDTSGCISDGNLASSVSQYGITWTFDKPYRVGHFVNGDWWVLGPVTVTAITPRPDCASDGSARNGSMLNPRFGSRHGYDGRADISPNPFDPGLCRQPPLELVPGDSLVSTESWEPKDTGRFTNLKSGAVLSVVDRAQPSDRFRPPYTRPVRVAQSASDPLSFSADSIDWSLLPRLPKVAQTPPLSGTLEKIERPWLDHYDGWWGGRIQPLDNMHDYGRDNANDVSEISLQLLLDYNDDAKRPLLYAFLQYGIDLYGVYQDGGRWAEGAGVSQGRKWPLVFTGLMLHNEGMKRPDPKRRDNVGNLVYTFQEDGQTYYFDDPTLPDCTNVFGQAVQCGTASAFRVRGERGWIGKLDGGAGDFVLWRLKDQTAYQHHEFEQLPISEWLLDRAGNYQYKGDGYRTCCSSGTFIGMALAARRMDAVPVWDHNAFFDYADRWMTQDDSLYEAAYQQKYGEPHFAIFRTGQAFSPFVVNMWKAYRGSITPLYVPAPDANTTPPPDTPPAQPPAAPVHRFALDGDLDDAAGGTAGTANGSVAFATGKSGLALDLNGSGFAKVNASPGIASAGTISFWLRYPASVSGTAFLDLAFGSNAHAVYIWDAGGRLRAMIDDDTGGTPYAYDLLPPGNIPIDTWVHYAVAYDASGATIYKDGVAAVSGSKNPSSAGLAVPINAFLGANIFGAGKMTGALDDVRFYDRVLTASEIGSLYQG